MPNQSILDSRDEIAQLDKSNMLGSIEALGKQIEHAWKEVQAVEFKPAAKIRNVVVAGMGGSGLGGDVIKHLFKDEITVPLEIVHSYTLPAYVNENTLVLLSSYSGTTEEVLACSEAAHQKNAQIMIIAAGGELAKHAQEHQHPAYIIDPIHNPSQQPRMAIGYAVFGTIGLLAKAGIITINEQMVSEVVATINTVIADNNVEVVGESNPAKTLAFNMVGRRGIIVAAEFLEGAAHVAANQHNENAKAFVDYKIIPELNHHLMEGLQFPRSNPASHFFLMIQSQLYNPKNGLRMRLTQQVIENNEIDTLSILLRASTKISQVFEMITLFAFTSFYLSMLEGIDPSPIPFVDYFKDELKKQSTDYQLA